MLDVGCGSGVVLRLAREHGLRPHGLDGVERLFLACGKVAGQVEHERTAIDAAQAAGVARIVKLSGPGVAPSLLFEAWHGEIERHLLASGLPSCCCARART